MGEQVKTIKEITMKEVTKQIGKNKDVIEIEIEGIPVMLTKQSTGYGERNLLVCPKCGERRLKLYLVNDKYIYCRGCSPVSPYKALQNSTEGGTREIHYRMDGLAIRYGIKFDYPFTYKSQIEKRPKHYRAKKWYEGIKKMQILENMRMGTIYFNKKYKSKLVKHILDNHNEINHSLDYLERYILDWHKIAKDIK